VDPALRIGSIAAVAVRALFHLSHVALTPEPRLPGTVRVEKYIELRPAGSRDVDRRYDRV
jgi:hypothetical protein